jgi:UDP-glucose 4-epimerase
MKYVVTGGAGFIGSHLVKHLLSEGHDVTIVDNMFRGRLSNLDGFLEKINLIQLDILDYEKLRNCIKNADGIFHQAALTSVVESYQKENEYHKVNVIGTENIFKIAKEFSIKVVYASSSSVYGNITKIPITETFDRKPINPYGKTKLDDEYLSENFVKSGSEIIGLRYFNVYGLGQTLDYAGVITKFLENISSDKPPVIFGDGSQIRDFVFVKDIARANLFAMESSITNGFFNIGTGIGISIKDLAHLMIKISNKKLNPIFDKLPEGDVKSSQADATLAKSSFNWNYTTKLEEGLSTLF